MEKPKKSETPLRMVLEAASYAIALRKNWERFRPEWVNQLAALQLPEKLISQVPKVLETVVLVAAAPASFWIDWLPITEKGRTVSQESWASFRSVLDEFGKANLPVSFVSLSGSDGSISGLAVQPLEFPIIR